MPVEFMTLFNAILSNPTVAPLATGAVISLLVAGARNVFASVDKAAKDPNQVKIVQAVIVLLSVLSSLAGHWAQGNLSTVDPQELINVVATIVAALGIHQAGKDIKVAVNK